MKDKDALCFVIICRISLEMEKRNIDVLGISETWWPDCGEFISQNTNQSQRRRQYSELKHCEMCHRKSEEKKSRELQANMV